MTAFDSVRTWLAKARTSKLSTRVTVLFAASLILPWCAYAWITNTERVEQIDRAQHNLAALSAAYAEHASALMHLGISVPTDDASLATSAVRGTQELSAFRNALNVPDVHFSLHRIGNPRDARESIPDSTPILSDANGTITAEVDLPAAGIAAAASLSEDEALRDWRARANIEIIGLVLRSLFVVGVGSFLARQLRWREAVEAELVNAKEAAESASRAKSEFLANMSHELRTPLNAILGFSEIIKSRTFGPVSDPYPEYAGDIFNSGTHLLALINDILNLSRLEAGGLTLQEEDVDLAATVEACVNLVETQARQAKIRLSVSLDRGVGWIRADDRRLRQILINLLSNAVKFTPEGGRVSVSSVLRSGGLAISVSDTGIGMASADIPKAMMAFGQLDSRVRRKQEGTGLGLPLAKQLVELHGGTFAIESRINFGTTVTFVLPPERIAVSPARPMAAVAVG